MTHFHHPGISVQTVVSPTPHGLPVSSCPPEHDALRVLDIATRNAIPPHHRCEGMWVLVLEEMTFYRLTGGLTNDCWVSCGHGGGDEDISPDDLPIASKTEKGIVQIGDNISVDAEGLIAVPVASDDTAGVVELASVEETKAGTDNSKAVTPAGLANALVQDKIENSLPIASKTEKGIVQIGDNISVDADGLIAVPAASDDTAGVVKGGGNVDVATDGTLSVPDLIAANLRGQTSVNSPSISDHTSPNNDCDLLVENGTYSLAASGSLNTPNPAYSWDIMVMGTTEYKKQIASIVSPNIVQLAIRNMWNGAWSPWRMLAGDLGVAGLCQTSSGQRGYIMSSISGSCSLQLIPNTELDGAQFVVDMLNSSADNIVDSIGLRVGRGSYVSNPFLEVCRGNGQNERLFSFGGHGAYFCGAGTTASAANVVLTGGTGNSSNQLLRSTSSLRYKTDVEPINQEIADSYLSNAKPIWYRSLTAYDTEHHKTDGKSWGYFGLGAEDLDDAGLKQLVIYEPHPDDYETVVLHPKQTVTDSEKGAITTVPEETETRPKEGHRWIPNGIAYDRIPVLLTVIAQKQERRIALLEKKILELETGIETA